MMYLRSDNKFVEDEFWHKTAERCETFLRTRSGEQKTTPYVIRVSGRFACVESFISRSYNH